MKQLGKTEAKIISLLHTNPAVMRAYEKMLEFFTVYDIIENTNHCNIIRQIYNINKNRQKSIVALSLNVHLSERTLNRYRKKYLKCINIYHVTELTGKEVAAADASRLSEYLF